MALCSDKTAAKGETCVALRQALIAKLQGQDKSASPAAPVSPQTQTQTLPGAPLAPNPAPAAATPAAAPAETGPDAETLAIWRKRWGFFMDMVGKTWDSASYPGFLTTYRWKTPGEEIEPPPCPERKMSGTGVRG